MSDDLFIDDDSLPVDVLRDVDRVCLEFEVQWRAGGRPDIGAFLQAHAQVERGPLFKALLAVELEYRQQAGESPHAQEYRQRFPDKAGLVDEVFAQYPPRQVGNEPTQKLNHPPEDRPDGHALPEKIGKYRVIERLGAGGQASVYRAVNPDLSNRMVVIKWSHSPLPDEAREGLLGEGKVLAELEGPGLVRVFDVDIHDGRPFIVMEHVDGRSLKKELEVRLPTPRLAAAWVASLTAALALVHRKGVLHRDLKPANVLIDTDRRPWLLDFGLASWVRPWHENQQFAGDISGTFGYMAPEQASGEADRIGPWTDVFGLGAILYALLTGRPPYEGETLNDVIEQARRGEIVPFQQRNARVPAPLKRICLKALAADPEDRYRSADELQTALRRYLRRRVLAWGSVAAIGGTLGAVWGVRQWLNSTSTDPPPPPAASLDGELIVKLYGDKQGLNIDQPGALPVYNGDLLHLEAHLDEPAYVYLVMLDSAGKLHLLYPGHPKDGWAKQLALPLTPQTTVHSPPEQTKGWKASGDSGLETVILLARREPIPAGTDLRALLGNPGPAPPFREELAHQAAWWAFKRHEARPQLERLRSQDFDRSRGQLRSLDFTAAEEIDDELVYLMTRVHEHFDLIRAVRFAHIGD